MENKEAKKYLAPAVDVVEETLDCIVCTSDAEGTGEDIEWE